MTTSVDKMTNSVDKMTLDEKWTFDKMESWKMTCQKLLIDKVIFGQMTYHLM